MKRINNFHLYRVLLLLPSIFYVSISSQIAYAQVGSRLPLVIIDTQGEEIPDNPKIISWVKVIDNRPGSLNNQFQPGTDYEGYAGIEIRGQSTQMFPKKSYSVELRSDTEADSSVSLLGMPAESDWVLYAPYSDKTLLRNALTYYLGRKMGAWQPGFQFCEVYLNGEYNGIYMLIEDIKRDSNRVNISKLKTEEISGDDLTGGYIIKIDRMEGVSEIEYFQTTPQFHYRNSSNYNFIYVYPKYDEIAAEQKSYIKKYMTDAENSLNGSNFADMGSGYRKYFDVQSFVDFQIIQEITNNVDGYRLSTFFYKNKDSKGGKLHAGPIWDFDLGYGNEDYTDFNLQTDTWLYPKFTDEYGGRIHWWARMMEEAGYRSAFIARWKGLRKGAFSSDSIMTFIDNAIDSLGDAIDRNFERWPVIGEYVWPNYFVGSSYEEEVDYLIGWLTDRMGWIDANVTLIEDNSADELKESLLVFPNPVRDRMNLYYYSAGTGKVSIELFDLTGHKVFSTETVPGGPEFQYLDLNIYPVKSGFYVLRLTQGGKLIGKKKILVSIR